MIPLLALALLLGQNVEGRREVDLLDLSCRTIFSAATREGKTLLATMQGSGRVDHRLFDHASGKSYALEDGRIPARMISKIVLVPNGFALVDRLRLTVVTLDGDGRFLRREDLRSLIDLPAEIRPVEVAPYRVGRLLLTYLDRDAGMLALADVDLVAKRFRTRTQRPSDTLTSNAFWCSDGDRLYFVRPRTGRIDQVDPESFRILKVVRNAREPVVNPYFKPGNQDALPLSRYLRILTNPVYLDGRIKLETRRFPDPDPRNEEIAVAILSEGRFRELEQTSYRVAESDGRQLWFDKESGDFEVVFSRYP